MKILPFLIFGAACIVASLFSMLLPDFCFPLCFKAVVVEREELGRVWYKSRR